MDTVITFTPASLFAGILGICAGISCIAAAIGWVIKVIKAARAPSKKVDERLTAIEKTLNADAQAAASGTTTPATQTFTPYLVNITASVLNVRKGPGTTYAIATQIRKGEVYTIVAEENGWGKLKSGAGWIYLGYTSKR